MVRLRTTPASFTDAPYHFLKATLPIKGFKKNEIKKCYISKIGDRFQVFAVSGYDYFHKVLNEFDLNNSFEEVD